MIKHYWNISTKKQKINIVLFYILWIGLSLLHNEFKDNKYWLVLGFLYMIILILWGVNNIYKRFNIEYKLKKNQIFWLSFVGFLFVIAIIAKLFE